MNYGRKPTFSGAKGAVPEVFILDFKGDFIEKTVEVTIGARLRSEQKFPDATALAKQIEQDIVKGRKWFEQNRV